MAKVLRNQTEVFLDVVEESKNFGEYNDCTVKSIAITTGVAYNKVHAALKKVGRKDRKGATICQMQSACLDLGFMMKVVATKRFKDNYPAAGRKLKNITTNHPERFNKAWKDGNNYILSCRSHVAPVVDGVNHDWTLGRKYRVNMVYEVFPV